jgi:uncharacterized surface protein with fasciclin (FAS1) repeats
VVHVIDKVLIPSGFGPLPNLVELASSSADLSTLVSLVQAAGLAGALQGPGPFTLFAPTNDAFTALATAAPSTFEALGRAENVGLLDSVLKYHVVGGDSTYSSGLLEDNMMLETLEGSDVTIMVTGGASVNSVPVDQADLGAINGVAHVIGSVLLPADFTCPTIVDVASASPDLFSTLVAAVGAADLVDALSGDGSAGLLTVFAPTNDAFAELDQNLLAALLRPENKALLVELLTYHVVPARAVSSELSDGQVVDTLLTGNSLTIGVAGGAVSVTGGSVTANVVSADVGACNGVVHVIDKVLIPLGWESPQLGNCSSLHEYLVDNELSFPTLVTALRLTDLLSDLQTSGDILTLFAPIDEAFTSFPKLSLLLEERNRDRLRNLLLHHLYGGLLLSTSLADGVSYEMSDLSSITVTRSTGEMSQVMVDTAMVVNPYDTLACDGVVHSIDQVLYPEGLCDTVVEVAQKAGGFSMLFAALTAANLTDFLSTGVTFTIFAPSDAAFAELPSNLVAMLLMPDNIALLQKVLTYHVITDLRMSDTLLFDGTMVPSAEGSNLTFSESFGSRRVNGVPLTEVDISACNGVIHAIEAVLIPEDFCLDTLQTAQLDPETFSTLLGLIKAAGLEDALRSANSFVVFAPTNEAFAAVDNQTLAYLANPRNVDLLRLILLGHVATGDADQLGMAGMNVPTLAGANVPVTESMDSLYFGGARITMNESVSCGGTIFAIDSVVLPTEEPVAQQECDAETECELGQSFLNGVRAEVAIPAGTTITPPAGMTGPITLTVETFNSSDLEITSLAAVRLGPAGATFNPAIEVCITVVGDIDSMETLTIAHSSDEGVSFKELTDVTVSGDQVCGYTSSFSIFIGTYKSEVPPAVKDDEKSSSTSLIALLVLAGLGLLLGLIYAFTNQGCCENKDMPDLEMNTT